MSVQSSKTDSLLWYLCPLHCHLTFPSFLRISQSHSTVPLHKEEQSFFSVTTKKNSHFPIQCFASFIMLSPSLPLPWVSGHTLFLLNLNVLLYLASVLRSETSISCSNQTISLLNGILCSFSNQSYCLPRVLLSYLKSTSYFTL